VGRLAAAAGGGGQGGFLVEPPQMQNAGRRFDRGEKGVGARMSVGGETSQREERTNPKDPARWDLDQGGNPGRWRRSQRNPAPPHLAIAPSQTR